MGLSITHFMETKITKFTFVKGVYITFAAKSSIMKSLPACETRAGSLVNDLCIVRGKRMKR